MSDLGRHHPTLWETPGINPISRATARAAALAVCQAARDVHEARLLLDMIGIREGL